MNDQVNDTAFGPYEERHKSTTAAINILGRVIMASVSAVGIYAVISGRAALLMPLYAMLLVDFFFALPAFYNRDLDSSLVDGFGNFKGYPDTGGLGQPGLGGPGGLGSAGGAANGPPNSQYTRYSLIAVSTATMIVKIYFLCVIWKCYRYLRLIELVSPIRLSEIYPHIHPGLTDPQYPIVRVLSSADSTDSSAGAGNNMAPPPYDSITSTMKPPNYEEAMKSSGMMIYPSATTTGPAESATTAATVTQSQRQQHAVVFTDPNSTTEHILPIPTQVISTISTNDGCCRALQDQQPSVQPPTGLNITTASCNPISNPEASRLAVSSSSATPVRSDVGNNDDADDDGDNRNIAGNNNSLGKDEANNAFNPVEPLSCPTGTEQQPHQNPMPRLNSTTTMTSNPTSMVGSGGAGSNGKTDDAADSNNHRAAPK